MIQHEHEVKLKRFLTILEDRFAAAVKEADPAMQERNVILGKDFKDGFLRVAGYFDTHVLDRMIDALDDVSMMEFSDKIIGAKMILPRAANEGKTKEAFHRAARGVKSAVYIMDVEAVLFQTLGHIVSPPARIAAMTVDALRNPGNVYASSRFKKPAQEIDGLSFRFPQKDHLINNSVAPPALKSEAHCSYAKAFFALYNALVPRGQELWSPPSFSSVTTGGSRG